MSESVQMSNHILTTECVSLLDDVLSDFDFDSFVSERYDADADVDVDELVEDFVNEHYSEISERINEYVDSHQYVIYTHWGWKICANCDITYGEDYVDEMGLSNFSSVSDIITAISYGEMVGRCYESLEGRVTTLMESALAELAPAELESHEPAS